MCRPRALFLQGFKESWAPVAARLGLVVHVFACPNRLSRHQLSHFVFGKTQARALAFVSGFTGPAAPLTRASPAAVAATVASPDGCALHLFLPAAAPPTADIDQATGAGGAGGGGGGGNDDERSRAEQVVEHRV